MTPTPQKAGLFHTGNTCPFCQETVDEGQVIVTCPNCGSIHHESCWSRKGKCSSYHCDDAVRSEVAAAAPDIRIDATELENVRVPPKPVRQAPEAVARQYAPQKPERLSRLTLAGVIVALLGLGGIAGALLRIPQLTILCLFLALLAIVLNVIALTLISSNRRLYGTGLSIASILASTVLVFIYFASLNRYYAQGRIRAQTDLKIEESLPKEEYLARLSPPISRALRSNVVIRHDASMLGEHSYGSGIILKVEGSRAYILTNKHVIGDGRSGKTKVTLFTGENSMAEVVWHAPGTIDVAVIACQALTLGSFQTVPVAEELARQGERVFAVGNPMELAWSYVEGAISGLRTSNLSDQSLEVYQTQTPLNPGNSGGGLYDLKGRLIGLNTWTYDKASGEGLGFATSTTSILKLMREAKVMDLIASAGKPDVPAEAPDRTPAEKPVEAPEEQHP